MTGRTRKGKSHTARKILGSLVVLGVLGGLVGLGAFSAFTATTVNSGNSITSGTVAINQHASATSVIYSASPQTPGATITKCIRVQYTGTLAASVRAYASAGITNGSNYTLLVERAGGGAGGTPVTLPAADMNCTGFVAGSVAFGTAAPGAGLNTLPTTWAAATTFTGKAAGAAWATNDAVDYKFTTTTTDDPTPGAHTGNNPTGTFTITWEAQNN